MAGGAPGCPFRGGERAGGKDLPTSPVLCQGQSWGPSGGAWSGEVELRLRVWTGLGTRTRCCFSAWRGAGCRVQRARARPSAGSRGQRLARGARSPPRLRSARAGCWAGAGPPGCRPRLWAGSPARPGRRRPHLAAVQRGLQFAVPVRPDEPVQREGGARAGHAGPQRRIPGGRTGVARAGGPCLGLGPGAVPSPRVPAAPQLHPPQPRAPRLRGSGGGAGGGEGGPGGRG